MATELSDKQRSLLKREIGGLLFAAEANSLPSARSRILLQHLRNHARVFTVTSSSEERQTNENEEIWDEYTELELAIP